MKDIRVWCLHPDGSEHDAPIETDADGREWYGECEDTAD